MPENVKQLGVAMTMYLSDHEGPYPMRLNGTDRNDVDQWSIRSSRT